ncbi:MAG: hypothetical protein IH819_10120, partial [Bacteroidetes bacterium]|nr:hypothetical protein [Bacteroidota bacterium]
MNVKKNLKKNNPEALESINKILEKIERTQINEAFKGIKRGKILLDVNLKVNRNTLELGQQHRDIKNLGEKVDKDDHDLVKLIRDLGDFIGLGKGEKIKTKITTKQSRMLEVIDLD